MESDDASQVKFQSSQSNDVLARRIYDKFELLKIGSTAPYSNFRSMNSLREVLAQDCSPVPQRPLRKEPTIHGGDGSISRNSSHADSLNLPKRQPINPGGDLGWQKAKGFARFIKDHASPRHHRVTAGGRIVPAVPNTPPPTFHDAFLEAFLNSGKPYRQPSSRQHSDTFQQHSFSHNQGHETYPGASDYSNRNHIVGLHPYLKIPSGFRVIQASSDGTIAIVIAGTTIYRCELMENGQTSCKVAAQGAMLSTSSFQQPEIMHTMDGTFPQYWYPPQPPVAYWDDPTPTIFPAPPISTFTSNMPTDQASWLETKRQLENDHDAQMKHVSQYFDQGLPQSRSVSSTPSLYTGTYQQQLEKLHETLQGWMTMLMDAERVLCFPKVLGHAGIESTMMKKQVILVKIDELSRKKQQLEARVAAYNPGFNTRAASESRYQESTRAPTEVDHHESNESNGYSGQFPDNPITTIPENRVLSPLALEFIPHEQMVPAIGPRDPDIDTTNVADRSNSSYHSLKSLEIDPKSPVNTPSGMDSRYAANQDHELQYQHPKATHEAHIQSISIHQSPIVDVLSARLRGEEIEKDDTRCAKQRYQAINHVVPMTKLYRSKLALSPRRSMPELQKIHVTSRIPSNESSTIRIKPNSGVLEANSVGITK